MRGVRARSQVRVSQRPSVVVNAGTQRTSIGASNQVPRSQPAPASVRLAPSPNRVSPAPRGVVVSRQVRRKVDR